MKKYYSNRIGLLFLAVFCITLGISACARLKEPGHTLSTSPTKPLPPDTYKNGVVVSVNRIASQVGVDILKKGGNAVDAAVAVSYALAVVHPSAGNIGGGGFFVIRTPDGKATTIDYREKAPGKAHRDMYLDEKGEVISRLTRRGALAVGVPGTVAGTLLALERYGTMSREEVLQPAIMLADTGFFITSRRGIGGDNFKEFPSTNAIFNKPDSSRWEQGERFVQKDLAKTFRIIAEKGHDGFYKGEVADLFVKTMEEHGGLITHEDLASYRAIEREPVRGKYRDYDIISMAPPSSGGVCLIEMLNILERYNIGELGYNTPESVHLMVEAMRRVYADRAEYLGDPEFYDVPVEKLISKKYADMRAKDINTEHATPSEQVTHGDVSQTPYESDETTHYSVVDKNGMAVAVTTTLEGGYGSHLVVGGAGFLLNNEMGDFSAKPGTPNSYGLLGGDANAIEPNKRMLSSMTPTIVTKNGKTFIVVGEAGGSRIITKVLQSIVNVIDHGFTAKEAFGVPGFHHQWYPDNIGRSSAFSEETIAKLEEFGHTVSRRGGVNTAQGVIIDPETGYLTFASGTGVGY